MEYQILSKLNKRQIAAATAPRVPLLILAGPGTGKTRTLIARIFYEIQHFLTPPDQILALTFSNKAAQEMKNRLQETLREKSEKVRCGTFHWFCLDVLRKNYEAAGLNKHFTVCDESYQSRLIHGLIANRLRENIDRKVKSLLLSFSNHTLKGKILRPFSAQIYDEYCAHLSQHRLVDFDQLLTKTYALFSSNPDILNQYRFLNQTVLVDEFQDTDPVQYQIIKLIADVHRRIFVVADDDQSIYAWRGANPDNIRQFMEDFHISAPLLLDENYRCGLSIMDTAQTIVASTQRLMPDKVITSSPERNAKIQALFFDDESQEIRFIIRKMKDWHDNQQVSYSDMAVLYPQHRFSEKLANALLQERLPYQLATGKNLADHPVMKKVILYLKLIRDPSDTLVLEELVECELGQHIYKQVQRFQTDKNSAFRKALTDFLARPEISYKIKNQLSTFIGNIANLVNLKSFYTFDRLIDEIIRGIQNLSINILDLHASKLSDFLLRKQKSLLNPNIQIWVYHSNPALTFLAQKMAEKVFGKRVHILDPNDLLCVSSHDFILLLEPVKLDTLPCKYELIFKHLNDHRKGILSALFRYLQLYLRNDLNIFHNYILFDLETTGQNAENCGIVEIAAIKVRDGEIAERFSRIVNPGIPIEPGAQAVHHISDSDVAGEPGIHEIWPQFLAFIENDMLIAHNGYSFDFKIIDRICRALELTRLTNIRYDSLILARNLYPNTSNSIDGLMERFRLKSGTRHRALEDVIVLHDIFQRLLQVLEERETRTSGEELTEYVTIGCILENMMSAVEDKIFVISGIRKLISPYSAIRAAYAKKFSLAEDELLANFQRHADRAISAGYHYNTNDDFFNRVLESAQEFKKLAIDRAIADYLSFISLVNPQDSLAAIDAVSLLTFYAAKGLEFDRVIIVGMEDDNMPSFFSYKNDDDDDRPVSVKLEEQKRLLYVGLTRAMNEVALTVVKNRFGKQQKSSPFLEEIKSKVELSWADS
jgi:DNA polymerase III epsilon subunit family exonuclease